MKKILLMLMLLLISALVQTQSAYAGYRSAKIQKLLFYEDGDLVYIYPVGGTGVAGSLSCHGGNGDYFSFKMSRPRAKEYISGLMLAFSQDKVVDFRYADNCIDQSVSATLMYFTVNR